MILHALTAHQTLTLWTRKEVVELHGNTQTNNTWHSSSLNSYLRRLTPHPRKTWVLDQKFTGYQLLKPFSALLVEAFTLHIEQPTRTKVSWI